MQTVAEEASLAYLFKPRPWKCTKSRFGFSSRRPSLCLLSRLSRRRRSCPTVALCAVGMCCSCEMEGFLGARENTDDAVTFSKATQRCGPNHTTPTPRRSRTRECELLHQHFIRRLNKDKKSYEVGPFCLRHHVKWASETLQRPLLMK